MMQTNLLAPLIFGALMLILGPLGFFLALSARERLSIAERRIASLEARLRAPSAPARATTAAPSPAPTPARAPAPTPARARTTPGQKSVEPTTEPKPHVPSTPRAEKPAAGAAGLEAALGADWSVWIGGVALALGALLLVRYSIEQGWFGPAARCVLGLALGAALIAAGEWLRRRETASRNPTQTPAVLSAAGAVAGFGAIYAAHGLYGFIGPTLAFAALGALGVATMLAAALHGPWLAGLGLVGAGAAPLLVASAAPDPWPVVLYLAIVQAAAFGLARLRDWDWLAEAAAAGAALWALLLAAAPDGLHAALAQTLIGAVAAALYSAFRRQSPPLDRVATILPGGLAGVAALVVASATPIGLDAATTATLCAILAGVALAGAFRACAAALLPIVGAAAVAISFVWPGNPDAPARTLGPILLHAPHAPEHFLVVAIFAASIVVGLATRRLAMDGLLYPQATAYAFAAAATPLAVAATVYLRLADGPSSLSFALVAAAIGAGFVSLAHFFRAAGSNATATLAQGVFATGALAALALALVFFLDRGMLTVALALSATAAAFVSARLAIPALRAPTAALGLLVLARLLLEPRIVGPMLGTTPIFNWLLLGYGAPALAFAAAARLLRRPGKADAPTSIAEALATLFAALLVYFEIRHALNGGDIFARGTGLVELGLLATTSLLFTLALVEIDPRRRSPIFDIGALLFGAAACVFSVGVATIADPLLSCRPLEGGADLLLGYAAPAAAAALLMRRAHGLRPIWFTRAAGALSVALLFLYASLETRRWFNGAELCAQHGAGEMEVWAYSAAWLALGVMLLVYGLVRGFAGARFASALFIVAATLKIFLYDLAGLEGLWRAFSFIGLGFVLIGVGLAYQKLVFTTRSTLR
jgi:uncharacterized membrane protein